MAYNSAHTGPEIDAAVQLLGQIQEARDSTSQDLIEVRGLAAQVKSDAGQVSTQAETIAIKASQVASNANAVEQARSEVAGATAIAGEAKDAATASAASAQESQGAASVSEQAAAQSQLAAGLSEQVSAESAAEAAAAAEQAAADRIAAAASAASAAASAQNAEAVVTGGTASVTPGPGLIPLADAQGKIDDGWIPDDVARAEAVQSVADTAAGAADVAAEARSRTAGFLPPSPEAPTARDDGSPLQVGDRYFDAVEQVEYIYKATGWALNDSLQAFANLAIEDDIEKGASLVSWDGGKLSDHLNASKKLATYEALESYSGPAIRVQITKTGISGWFNRIQDVPASTPRGIFLTDALGRVWQRDYGLEVDPVWCGADPTGVADSSTAYTLAMSARGEVVPTPGTYHLKASARIPVNGVFRIRAMRGNVTFTGDKDVVLFTRTPGSSVRGIHLTGLAFDGQHIRNQRPYRDYQNDSYGFPTAFGLEADPYDPESFVRIENCHFRRIASLPFSVSHFKDVTMTESSFFKTKDPGFRYNRNVRILGGMSEWSADNGLSVSRGNLNVTIAGFTVKDATSDGIFVSGWNTTGATSISLTVTGTTYATGDSVQVFASASGAFAPADVETLMHVRDPGGTGSGVMRITGYTSSQQVAAVVIQPIPAAIQNVATNLWAVSPHNGPLNFSLTNCVIVGANVRGVAAMLGSGKGVITGLTVLRTGMVADSEKVTKGSIAAGSTQLTVLDPAIFTAGAGVILDPKNSMQDYFVARINSISGNVLTLSRAAPMGYGLEDARHCTLSSVGAAIALGGNMVGWNTYAEQIKVADCVLLDYRSYAIDINSDDAGSVRSSEFIDNRMGNPSGMSTKDIDIYIRESTGMPMSDLFFESNRSLSTLGRFIVVEQHSGARRSIFVSDNKSPYLTTANHFKAYNLDAASADISSVYPISMRDSYNIEQHAAIKYKNYASGAIDGSGQLSVSASLMRVTPTAGGQNLVSLSSALGDGGLVFMIANNSPTDTITIKYDPSKIRTKTKADVVIPGYGAATFAMIDSIAQQTG